MDNRAVYIIVKKDFSQLIPYKNIKCFSSKQKAIDYLLKLNGITKINENDEIKMIVRKYSATYYIDKMIIS